LKGYELFLGGAPDGVKDTSEVVAVVDAFSPRQRQDRAVAGIIRQRWMFAVALEVILIGLGFALLQRGSVGTGETAWPSSPTREQSSKDLIELTKGLQATQQQAVDQLQIVQDQLVAQKAETKRLSEQIATLTEKLDALQQSIANTPTSAAKSR
jgi:septal ring factor EnvC (AmiA/AmiB activator)